MTSHQPTEPPVRGSFESLTVTYTPILSFADFRFFTNVLKHHFQWINFLCDIPINYRSVWLDTLEKTWPRVSQNKDSIYSCVESAIINDCISRSQTNQMPDFSDARSSPVLPTLRIQTKGLAHQLSLLFLQCQHSLFYGIRDNVLKIKKYI